MANFEFDVDGFLKSLDFTDKKVRKAAEQGMEDAVNDLVRVSSDIAPIDKGTLSKSVDSKVYWTLGNSVVGEVSFSIREGKFNYALWTHEEVYKHGEGTLNNPPAQGMSGKSYYAGRKYLERPLKGESDTYRNHIAETIRKELT